MTHFSSYLKLCDTCIIDNYTSTNKLNPAKMDGSEKLDWHAKVHYICVHSVSLSVYIIQLEQNAKDCEKITVHLKSHMNGEISNHGKSLLAAISVNIGIGCIESYIQQFSFFLSKKTAY